MNARKLAAGLRLVAEALEESATASNAPPMDGVYTSLDLPPDVRTRATFHEVCKRIVGAEKRGRVWVVPRDVWHSARRSGGPKAAPARAVVDVDATVAAMAAAYRATR